MDAESAGVTVGTVGSLVVVAMAVVPFLVADAGAIGVYYAAGFVGPPFLAVLAIVTGVALAAGHRRRSDPATAAGIAVVMSLMLVVFSLTWAVSVTPSLLGGLTEVAVFQHHRWAVVVAGILALVGSGLYTRAVV
ncbi:MAG: hypothetical protein SVG88_04635 [Halobacteriales archaeon]|nr:hypothetical protein [Halobacteriales archaeon]